MCPLCNGEGGINLYHSWGAEYLPCNHPECDFDRMAYEKELDEVIEQQRVEILARDSV